MIAQSENNPIKKFVEVDAWQHMPEGKKSGKTDIPCDQAELYKNLREKDIGLTCEFLRTGEVAWYLEHLPTKLTLASVISRNLPNGKKEHLEVITDLFNSIDVDTVQEQIDKEVNG